MNWDIGNWREQRLLLEALKELGANVSFWDEREGTADTSDAESRERVADLIFQHARNPSQLVLDEAMQLASKNGMVRGSEISVFAGDVLAIGGNLNRAIDMYMRAIDAAPKPSIHAELGYEVLRRAQIDPLPLGHDDLAEMEPELTLGLFDSGPKAHERLKIFAKERNKELLSLAIDAYGRAYGYTLYRIGIDHPDEYINPWVHLLVLDGLRVALLEADRPDLVDLTCISYDAWTDALGTAFADWGEDVKMFERRFGQTRGYLEGRRVELTVQQAVEEARRVVVVSGPDAFATQVAETVVARLGPVPLATRTQIEERLNELLNGAWNEFADSIRQFLVEGEWLKDALERMDAHDLGSVVVYYAKAAEGYLRQITGSTDILSAFRRNFRDRQPFLVALFGSSSIDSLSERIIAIANARDDAAHGDPRSYRPITRSRMTEIRAATLGSKEVPGLMALLHRHRKK